MAREPATVINSLIQYPIGTVVLTVKPPGSCYEFEIKRAGAPGPLPISAVFERNGQHVPPAHRLHAASMGWHLATKPAREPAFAPSIVDSRRRA